MGQRKSTGSWGKTTSGQGAFGFQELVAELNRGNIAPVYLFHGDEQYLCRRALAALKQKLLPGNLADWNLEVLEGKEISPEGIVAVANSLPMMGQSRIVVVADTALFQSRQNASKDSGADDQKKAAEVGDGKEALLIAYLADPNPATCLVFLAASSVDARKKLYKEIKKTGRVVEFAPPERGELNTWVRSVVKDYGKEMDAQALEYLVSTVSNNLALLENELAKACLYLGPEQTITLPVLRQVASRTIQAGVFDMVDAAGEKKPALAIRLLREMFLLGEQPVPLALMLARQVRLMLQAKVLGAGGCQGEQLAAAMRVHPFVARKAHAQARNYRQEDLERAMEQCLELDAALKSGRGDPRLLVEMAVLRLCL